MEILTDLKNVNWEKARIARRYMIVMTLCSLSGFLGMWGITYWGAIGKNAGFESVAVLMIITVGFLCLFVISILALIANTILFLMKRVAGLNG